MTDSSPNPLWPRPSLPHRIVFEDDALVVVSKPSHLLVHRTEMAAHDHDSLRDRLISEGVIDHSMHPVNRIDRPTSGLVLFAKNLEAHRMLHAQFTDHTIEKRYLAIVRGWMNDVCQVTKPLATSHSSKPKEACTHFTPLARYEWDVPITRYPTSRFSLVDCRPETGRYHQIRLHLRHLRHPIIGDTAHGDKPHNRYFESAFTHRPLYLHASHLAFQHPDGSRCLVEDPLPENWSEVMSAFGWDFNATFNR
jgi:tRNA pseudouridine65 synthase